VLLDKMGFRSMIEIFGGVIPWTLEAVYLLLYAIPPLCMGALYFGGARDRADRFLLTLFLGTFATYALLPYFPTASPRVAFPNEDLPHYASIWRSINVWLLDRYDISTSVFPSGHVAVAFSSAFGLLRAVPHRRLLWSIAFGAATLVFAGTVYGRYHYAADGIASVGISVAAWFISGVLDANE
jgi:membrane-associated phospholipid phosphatase